MQQLDAQGPSVVQQITTQVGPLACSPNDVQKIVDALHNGTPVTLSSTSGGQTSTFTPSGQRIGYGEAYIALALAAEQLRNSGVTSCATADQWQSVLFGGPISTSSSVTASTSSSSSGGASRFPGILTLRQQGQGWGQIAQASNVQLGTIVSSATSALNSGALAPTGTSSRDMYRSGSSSSSSQSTGATSTQSSGLQSWPTYAPGSGAGGTQGSSSNSTGNSSNSSSSDSKSSGSNSSSESSDETPSGSSNGVSQ